ncbi:hypothetical protein TELCIR_21567, partial [Teladorsagia circumcincta]
RKYNQFEQEGRRNAHRAAHQGLPLGRLRDGRLLAGSGLLGLRHAADGSHASPPHGENHA